MVLEGREIDVTHHRLPKIVDAVPYSAAPGLADVMQFKRARERENNNNKSITYQDVRFAHEPPFGDNIQETKLDVEYRDNVVDGRRPS